MRRWLPSEGLHQVVQLRRELAAAQDYERLSLQASELRGRLAKVPIVATRSWPAGAQPGGSGRRVAAPPMLARPLVLLRTSIFQVPPRSMAPMAVLTVEWVAS